MRGSLAVLCLLTVALDAGPVLPVDYVFIAQRPDEAGAVHVPYHSGWIACCSAYSASTVNFYHPTPPVTWVQLSVYLTATTSQDAVRLRIINTATGETETLEEMAPTLVGAARPLGIWLDANAWNSRSVEHTYVLEVRGTPTIYGAKLRVGYQGV